MDKNVSGRTIFKIGIVILIFFGVMSLIVSYIQKEDLTYYKTCNVKITENNTGKRYEENRSDDTTRYYDIYDINFKSADGQIDVTVETYNKNT